MVEMSGEVNCLCACWAVVHWAPFGPGQEHKDEARGLLA